jgi:RHS repeat-associated protein
MLHALLWLGMGMIANIHAATLEPPKELPGGTTPPGARERIERLSRNWGSGSLQPLRPVGNSALEVPDEQRIEAIYQRASERAARIPLDPGAGANRRLANLVWAEELEAFVREKPDSAWTPGVRLELVHAALKRLNYSNAEEHLIRCYEAVADSPDPAARDMARDAGRLLGRLMVLSGQLEEFDLLRAREAKENPDWVAGTWYSAVELRAWIARYPNEAYKCGLQSLDQLGRLTSPDGYDPMRIYMRPSKPDGYEAGELVRVGQEVGLALRIIQLPQLDALPVPSIAHMGFGHYVVLRRGDGSFYEVLDPATSKVQWLTAAELETELTGVFVVAQQTLPPAGVPFRELSPAEASLYRGRCYHGSALDFQSPPPCEEECCPPGGSGPGGNGGSGGRGGNGCNGCGSFGSSRPMASVGSSRSGMPTWWVNEPYLNLYISDTPMQYQPALGPAVNLTLRFGTRSDLGISSEAPGSRFDGDYYNHWFCSWLGWIDYDTASGNQAEVFLPSGARMQFTFSGSNWSTTNYWTYARLEKRVSGSTVTNFFLHYPDGARLEFGNPMPSTPSGYLMTAERDPQGRATTFSYVEERFLKTVTAADGTTFTVVHQDQAAIDTGSPPYQSRVIQVTNSLGWQVQFAYQGTIAHPLGYTSPGLSMIVDAAGITNHVYARVIGENYILTPYGRTFIHVQGANGDPGAWTPDTMERVVDITFPDGSQQAYGAMSQYTGVDWVPWPTAQQPNTTGAFVQRIDTADRQSRNTFFWSTEARDVMTKDLVWNTLDWTDLRRARIRHWLTHTEDEFTHWGTLSWEQAPSPDGTSEGGVVWYDYVGKPAGANYNRGSQVQPAVIARVMPDGTTSWTSYERNTMGAVTRQIDKWTVAGAATYRTNWFYYDSGNGRDLVLHVGPDGTNEVGFAYDQVNYPHLPIRMTNGIDKVTHYTYDSSKRPLTTRTPSDLLSTSVYYASNDANIHYRNRLKTEVLSRYSTGIPISTNEFTWLNGMVRTHKDPANLLLTHTYDALNRLTRLDYPDGTFETNGYANGSGARLLHRTRHRDRLGFVTGWEYDSRERALRETNTLGRITFYEYCDCGDLPKSIVQASGTAVATTNRFIYDFQGNVRTNILVDGSSLIHKYDTFGNLTNTVDAFTSTTNTFDNLGRLAAVSNSLGRVTSRVYDVEDRVTSATDANGVTVTLTYDGLGRLRTRTYPGGAVEGWGYQQDGLNVPTHYTNQVNKVTTYAYDPLGRKTSEIQVGVWTNIFAYTPAGDLLTLSDGKAQVTTWGYNAERQVVSKKYPNGVTNLTYSYFPGGLLSNRWSQAKGSTLYRFNAMGSLTNVIYPSGTTNLTFHYDALERMTNMVDSVGTTRITYTLGGSQEIVAEDGPWTGANDTVTVTNRLGRSLGVRIAQPAGSWQQTHGYTGGRLSSVVSPAGTFTYSYTSAAGAPASASTLVQRILLPTTGGNAYITNTYDSRARLLSTQLRNELHAVLNSHAYLLDGLMRTRMTRTDGSYEDYGYDNAGQLRTVTGSAGGTNSFSYGYDAAQNLAARTNGVTVQTFTVNNLNQLTGGPTASYTHDSNGNLTGFGSGNGVYLYDAENQLVTAYVTNNWKSDFLYDGRGRLRTRKEFNWSGGTWSLSTETRYLYEGMRVVQERNGSDVPQVTYTRGTDLSGGREGAGGIGGLLGRSHGYNAGTGAWATHHFYHADGNGNVTYLVNTSRTLGASYRYDAYGRTTATGTGTLAPSDNVYRFSSKELHAKSGLYYYGYRFYDPNLQRWLTRDPIGEAGGINLYAFVGNRPINSVDPFGESDLNRPPSAVSGPGMAIYGPPRPEPMRNAGAPPSDVHGALDVAGLVDPTGLADALNAAAYGLQGDLGNAGISAAAAFPFGDFGKLGRMGKKICPVPGKPFRGKGAPEKAYEHLNKHHGVSPEVAGNRLHKLKKHGNLAPDDDVIIGRTGDVYNGSTGERLGSLTDPSLGK